LNFPGLAHGLSTAPLASRQRKAGGGAVDNPAHCLSDQKSQDDISFQSPAQTRIGPATLEIKRNTYIRPEVAINDDPSVQPEISRGRLLSRLFRDKFPALSVPVTYALRITPQIQH
jgi:hypothetical protein